MRIKDLPNGPAVARMLRKLKVAMGPWDAWTTPAKDLSGLEAIAEPWADRIRARDRECYHALSWGDYALEAANVLMGGYGVEGFTYPDQFRYGVSYVNMGDTYEPTLIYDSRSGRLFTGDGETIANMLERAEA